MNNTEERNSIMKYDELWIEFTNHEDTIAVISHNITFETICGPATYFIPTITEEDKDIIYEFNDITPFIEFD